VSCTFRHCFWEASPLLSVSSNKSRSAIHTRQCSPRTSHHCGHTVSDHRYGGSKAGTTLGDIPVTLIWVIGDAIPSVLVYGARVDEMLVQMISKLEDIPFHCARHHDIVDQASESQPISVGHHRRWREPTSNG
jgi:hypothetical protein